MRTRDTAAGAPEVLEIGHDPGPPRHALTAAVGALCLALGVGAGASLSRGSDEAGSRASADEVLLSVGAVEENGDLLDGPRYVARVHNLGPDDVTLESVGVLGWDDSGASQGAVEVPAGEWATAPLDAMVVCDANPPFPARVVVRGTLESGTFEEVLPLSTADSPLSMDWMTRCDAVLGRPPTPDELEGVWMVRWGEYLDSIILLHFLPGRRFVLEDETTASIFDSGRVVGRYTLSGWRLTVKAETGFHCRFGDHWTWRLALTDWGTLDLRHIETGTTGCRPDLGRLWVAERLDPDPPLVWPGLTE